LIDGAEPRGAARFLVARVACPTIGVDLDWSSPTRRAASTAHDLEFGLDRPEACEECLITALELLTPGLLDLGDACPRPPVAPPATQQIPGNEADEQQQPFHAAQDSSLAHSGNRVIVRATPFPGPWMSVQGDHAAGCAGYRAPCNPRARPERWSSVDRVGQLRDCSAPSSMLRSVSCLCRGATPLQPPIAAGASSSVDPARQVRH